MAIIRKSISKSKHKKLQKKQTRKSKTKRNKKSIKTIINNPFSLLNGMKYLHSSKKHKNPTYYFKQEGFVKTSTSKSTNNDNDNHTETHKKGMKIIDSSNSNKIHVTKYDDGIVTNFELPKKS